MQVFVTGGTGLIGRRLVLDRLQRGDRVVVVTRDKARASRLFAADANPQVRIVEGNPTEAGDWQAAIDGCDAVVHLAGAGVADRRWSAAYKREIVESRVQSTRRVVEAIRRASEPPGVLVSASATGIYSDTGPIAVDEKTVIAPHDDFLADLSRRWEAEAGLAASPVTRVVLARMGFVLDDRGGALPKMAQPIRFFVGGRLGHGRQYIPWIHHRDVIGLLDLALSDSHLDGPLNVVGPNPATNRDFTATLARVLKRPAFLPVPKFALRIAVGELGSFITMSHRVLPTRALARGYVFRYPHLEPALHSLLSSSNGDAETNRPIVSKQSAPVRPMIEPAAAEQTDSSTPIRPSIARGGPPAPVRLLAIDVDGTLLRSDLTIAASVIQACRAAERAGCAVVLATARSPRTMRWITQTLGLNSPTINCNGALLWQPQRAEALHHEPLEPELTRELVETLRSSGEALTLSIDVLDKWYIERLDVRKLGERGLVIEPDHVGPIDAFLGSPITRMTAVAEAPAFTAAPGLLRDRFASTGRVTVFNTEPQVLHIGSPRVDKALALARLAASMNLGPESVMAIGDADNDMAMMRFVGFGVAVGNATEAIKDAADVTVATNDDQGVAMAIQRYVLARR